MGVGQKSFALVLTGASRCLGSPKCSSLPARSAAKMSLPTPGMRVDAMYRLNPSRDSIGQPSLIGLFTSTTGVATLHAHQSSCEADALADANMRANPAAAQKRSRVVMCGLLLECWIALLAP